MKKEKKEPTDEVFLKYGIAFCTIMIIIAVVLNYTGWWLIK